MSRLAAACICTAIATAQLAADAPVAEAPVENHTVAACAAFASDGASVAATIDVTTVSADFTDARGHVSHLVLPFDDTPANPKAIYFPDDTTCRVYFDRENARVAIGAHYRRGARIAVADVKQGTWLRQWTVGPMSGIFDPRVAGFLGENLLVGGQPFTRTARSLGIRHGSIAFLAFDPEGSSEASPRSRSEVRAS